MPSQSAQVQDYRDLIAWQKAFALGLAIYELTGSFPDSERFGLVSQLRRGSVSVASNIAEGYGRGSTGDYLRFLKVARGCLFEVDTQLLFAKELALVDREAFEHANGLLDESVRVLSGLIRSLERAGEE